MSFLDGGNRSAVNMGGGGGGLVDKAGTVTTDALGEAVVAFNTDYGDLNYFIQLTAGESVDATTCNVKTGTKTTSGFTVITMDDGGKAEPNIEVYWITGPYSNP